MTIETRVGYVSTSIIENMLKEYIIVNPNDVEAHGKYLEIRKYNEEKKEK